MSALADATKSSQDTIEKRFRRAVGMTPKHYARLSRLRYAAALFRPGMCFTDLALDAGYFDQSHFIRDVKAVTGETPRQFFGR